LRSTARAPRGRHLDPRRRRPGRGFKREPHRRRYEGRRREHLEGRCGGALHRERWPRHGDAGSPRPPGPRRRRRWVLLSQEARPKTTLQARAPATRATRQSYASGMTARHTSTDTGLSTHLNGRRLRSVRRVPAAWLRAGGEQSDNAGFVAALVTSSIAVPNRSMPPPSISMISVAPIRNRWSNRHGVPDV